MEEINKNLILSERTKTSLDATTISSIQTFAEIVETMYGWTKKIDNVSEYIESNIKNGNSNSLDPLRRLCEYSILVGLIWLDLATAFRIYINSRHKYEVIYSVKQLVVIINEGYKKIYNFVNLDKNGIENLKNRNNSFWVKDIGTLVSKELPSLLNEYEQITNKLESYFEQNFDNIKSQRDLAVHYDDNPSKVYAMLIGLNIENIAVKTIPFMNILSETLLFCKSIVSEYNILTTQRSNDSFNEQLQKLENLKIMYANKPGAIEILNDFKEKWIELNKQFMK